MVVINMILALLSSGHILGLTASIIILSNTLAITGLLCLQAKVLKGWEKRIRDRPLKSGGPEKFSYFDRGLNSIEIHHLVVKEQKRTIIYFFILAHEFIHKMAWNAFGVLRSVFPLPE